MARTRGERKSGGVFGLRQGVIDQLEALLGRHDEPAIYGGPPGDLGLVGGPRSMSWEINGDLASVIVAGPAAVLMEVLHPSVAAGVVTQSSFRSDPLRRARNTLGYVLRTTFGSTAAATRVIDHVRAMHGRVQGVRPDGVRYDANDPELLTWVHTTIPWTIMTVFDRYVRPLSRSEKDRYLREQARMGRMMGAEWVPETASELEAYVERMRPQMAVNEQTRDVISFLGGDTPGLPGGKVTQVEQLIGLHGSMSLMPRWAQELTGTDHPEVVRRTMLDPINRMRRALVRWAYPVLPCKELALARAVRKAPLPSVTAN